MTIVLVRYCEIGLKSTPVRRRFEKQLKDNIMSMLASDGVESLIEQDGARFFIYSDDISRCVTSLKKVFGIASVSPAVSCSSDLNDICDTAAKYSIGKTTKGMSFAVRARREGDHNYTSMDVGKEAGSAIYLANEGLKVDLQNPDITFYIEIRNNKAFVFHEYIHCPGGLPMGTQGKVLAHVNDKRGELSAWMMMKRGCRVLAFGSSDMNLLKKFDPSLKILESDDDVKEILGRVYGKKLESIDEIDWTSIEPAFLPTVAMDDDEVESMYEKTSNCNFYHTS